MNITSRIVAEPKGGTVSLTGDELPATGYFVGGLVSPLVLDESEVWTRDAIEQIDTFIEYLNGPTVGAAYVGWWTDEETGKLWVDGTSHHSGRSVAGLIAGRRHEIAFWDIEGQREIRV